MKPPRSVLLGMIWLILSPTLVRAESSLCRTDLDRQIEALRHPRDRWGVLVETLSPPRLLYRRNADRYFIPASNVKLLTTAAALSQLGANFRVRTAAYATENGLHVVGRGDPSLSTEQLASLARQVREAGIERVNQLIGDDTYFRGAIVHPNWEWEDVQAGYGAPVNSLIANRNAIALKVIPQQLGQPLRLDWLDPREALRVRVDNRTIAVAAEQPEFLQLDRSLARSSIQLHGQLVVGSKPAEIAIAVPDPAQHFLRQFRHRLEQAGVTVGRVEVGSDPKDILREPVAVVFSPPLGELVGDTNRLSDNLYAEVLLRWLGVNREQERQSTVAAGLEQLQQTLSDLGVEPESYQLADGSGLSRQNLVSPAAIVQTLRGMANSPHAEIYRDSLPLGGESGTLRSRFRNSPVRGRVRAKTGTLTGVSALSGYLTMGDRSLIFSILINHSPESATDQRQAIDRIVTQLTRLRDC